MPSTERGHVFVSRHRRAFVSGVRAQPRLGLRRTTAARAEPSGYDPATAADAAVAPRATPARPVRGSREAPHPQQGGFPHHPTVYFQKVRLLSDATRTISPVIPSTT